MKTLLKSSSRGGIPLRLKLEAIASKEIDGKPTADVVAAAYTKVGKTMPKSFASVYQSWHRSIREAIEAGDEAMIKAAEEFELVVETVAGKPKAAKKKAS